MAACYSYIYWYENLIRTNSNSASTAVNLYAQQGHGHVATPGPSHSGIHVPFSFRCVIGCPFKITQFTDTNFMTFEEMCHKKAIAPCPYLQFVSLFLENNFSEELVLERIPISKETFNQWRYLCRTACYHWKDSQMPIDGTNLDVDVENIAITMNGENGGSTVITLFKATVRNRINPSEGVVIVLTPDKSVQTFVYNIRRFVRFGNNLYVSNQKTLYAILDCDILLLTVYTLKNAESESASENLSTQSEIAQFRENLTSRVLSSGLLIENIRQNFVRHLFLSRYSQKETQLHYFLLALANVQK